MCDKGGNEKDAKLESRTETITTCSDMATMMYLGMVITTSHPIDKLFPPFSRRSSDSIFQNCVTIPSSYARVTIGISHTLEPQ